MEGNCNPHRSLPTSPAWPLQAGLDAVTFGGKLIIFFYTGEPAAAVSLLPIHVLHLLSTC